MSKLFVKLTVLVTNFLYIAGAGLMVGLVSKVAVITFMTGYTVFGLVP